MSDPGRGALVRRFAGFAGLPLISLLAPFLLLPVIARVGGAGGWSAVLVGQAVGGLGGVVAGLGWSLVGPSAVARTDKTGRATIYARAVASQLAVITLAVPLCGAVVWVTLDSDRWTAVAMSTAMVLGALSPSWFSIGAGRPSYIATYEIFPRLLASGLAVVLVVTTRQLWTYPLLLVVATLLGTAAFSRRVAKVGLRELRTVAVASEIWASRSASGTVSVGGSYSQSPVLVVAAVETTGGIASFGSADRLFRLSLTAIQVVTNAFQAWVSEVDVPAGHRINRRMRAALGVHLLLGALGLASFTLLGPIVTGLLFTEELASTFTISTLSGVAFAGIALNSALGRLVLVPQGRTRAVFVSTVVGALVGLTAMTVLGGLFGAVGVAAGFALSEVAVTTFQAVTVVRNRPPQRSTR